MSKQVSKGVKRYGK